MRHRVRDPRLEAVLLAGPEPVRGIRERLVQPPRVQLDERAESGDERVARDRPAGLRIHPGLIPHRLRLREAIGERQRVDGEDVRGVVLGVQRAGGERVLRALECLLDGSEPPRVVVREDGVDHSRARVVGQAEGFDPLHLHSGDRVERREDARDAEERALEQAAELDVPLVELGDRLLEDVDRFLDVQPVEERRPELARDLGALLGALRELVAPVAADRPRQGC